MVSAKDASGNQTVGFVDNPTFAGTVTAPTFVTSGANPVTMGNGTVSGLTNTTFDPKATYTGGQAATQEQLSSASSQLNNTLTAKGMDYMGDSGTVVHRDLGTQVNVKGGATGTLTSGNIGVVADGTDTLNVQLAKDVNLGTDGSLTAGNTKVNNTGVTISNGTKGQPVSLTASGLNNGGNTITNVAAGTADTDAVNLSQLNQVAANQKTSSVKAGTNIASVDATTSGNNTEYTVNAKGTTVTQGDGIDLTTTDAGSNTTNYKVGLNQATKDSLAKADSALQTISSSNPNVVVSAKDASGNQTVGFVDNPTFAGTVTAPTFTTSGNNAVTVSGNTGTINGLTNKTFDPNAFTSGQAATEDQLAQVSQQAAQKGSFNVTAQGTNSSTVNNGNTLDLRNTDGNIKVSKNAADNTVNFDLAKNIKVDSMSAGNTLVNNTGVTINNGGAGQPITLTATGLNNGGNKITNVATGIEDTDAVNVAQLNAVANTAAAAVKSTVVNGKNTTVSSTINPDKSTIYRVDVNTDDTTITTNAAGKLTAITNSLTNTAKGSVNTPTSQTALATASDVANVVNNSGFNLTAQGTNASLVKPGSTVDLRNNDGNLVVSKSSTDNTVNYDLAKNVKVDSVNINNSTVALNNNGLNNGGNTITNVADGSMPNDAVNVGQLNGLANNVNNALNQMGYKISDVEDNANAGVSAAMATAALPQAYLPGKSMVAGGLASYNGQGAAAIGVSKLSDNGRWVIKVNGTADTQGNFGGAVGAGFHW